MGKILCAALLVLLASGGVCGQGIYKWTDKNGVIHFSNAPTASENQKPERVLQESPAAKRAKCVYPNPVSMTRDGTTGALSKSYDYNELEAYHECVKRQK